MRITAVLLVGGLLGSGAGASDWPQWRGPEANGTSDETGLAVRWSADRNVVWKLAMPSLSGSTPIVVGEHIFLNVGTEDRLELWAVGRDDGAVLWRRPLGVGNRVTRKHNMSSPSPVSDGRHVWVLTGTGVLKAFDLGGTERWGRNLQDDYGTFGLNHGYGSSPLLHGGTLFVQVLHGMKTDDPSYVLAIDPASGETRWRVERPTDARVESPDSYTTPAVVRVGERQELVITGGDYVTGHDLTSGTELWRVGGLNPSDSPMYRIVASPVVSGSMIYVPSRVRPLLALQLPESGEPTVAWSLERGTDVPTPATDGELFYMVNDRGIFSCLNAETGEPYYEGQRLSAGTYSASPVVADGKVYVTSEDGVTSVLAAGREFKLLAENELDGFTLSSPAIANGRIYLRTEANLYCIDRG